MAAARRSNARAKIHGGLKVGWIPHLHIHSNVLREAANVEFGLLLCGDVARMAQHRLEAVRELLDGGVEG